LVRKLVAMGAGVVRVRHGAQRTAQSFVVQQDQVEPPGAFPSMEPRRPKQGILTVQAVGRFP
jgi:hypothetical protein